MTDRPLPRPTMRIARLVECVCEEIAKVHPVCYCGPLFGGDTPIDFCNECDDGACGQAWVRLVQAFPSSIFPQFDEGGSCTMPLAYEWEVGVARCAPTLDEQGNPPTREQNLDAVVRQYEDMDALRRAILCCFGVDDIDYTLGVYQPIPVQGGCNVATWQVWSR